MAEKKWFLQEIIDGYQQMGFINLSLAEEFFPLEEEAEQRFPVFTNTILRDGE
ncbi:MAG: hypothetical protein RR396_05940 [Clostridiales bacterium]